MAKRIINRKEQRQPMDEEAMELDGLVPEDDTAEEAPVKKTRKKATKKATKRTVTANKEVRLKAFWAVYSQSLQCVKLFEYGEKEGAEKLAAELTETKKAPHFVRLEKQVIE